jgi:molecular chaperone GrpE (heat shock protein)
MEAEAMLARERKAREESDARVFALENAFKDMESKYDKLAALMGKYMTKQPILN